MKKVSETDENREDVLKKVSETGESREDAMRKVSETGESREDVLKKVSETGENREDVLKKTSVNGQDREADTKKIIEMNQIDKIYSVGGSELHALKKVSLSVEKGEFLAVLGPSGSGKSTLMNIIGCMDVPDGGTYFLDGIPIHTAKEKQLTRIRNEKIGFVFQKYHLIPTYNVLQNIVMPLLIRGMTLEEAESTGMETIEMLGLADRIHHRPRELSGGQQQRVAIARALIGEPALLLADEPTGALDQASGQEVLKLFRRLNEMGNTIVMITHDLAVAENAQRIVRIVDGELVASHGVGENKRRQFAACDIPQPYENSLPN